MRQAKATLAIRQAISQGSKPSIADWEWWRQQRSTDRIKQQFNSLGIRWVAIAGNEAKLEGVIRKPQVDDGFGDVVREYLRLNNERTAGDYRLHLHPRRYV